MIISNLTGGLGNQMFQYALGKVLAEKNHDDLKLDVSSFNVFHPVDTLRSFELGSFKLTPYIATRSEVMALSDPNPIILTINRALKLNISPYPKAYTREPDHSFHHAILESTGDRYLQGFWQSEKYFVEHRELILKEFKFRNTSSIRNRVLQKQIIGTESVSIHVRRGDYVTNSNANKFHGTCDLSYYHKAIKTILKKSQDSTFFVFSDDIEWCKKSLKIKSKTVYVNHNQGEKSWEDMRLMSLCKHNIIANSSFSWWGAWLNTNPNKVVIAPKKWFRDKNVNSYDLIPSTWIKL